MELCQHDVTGTDGLDLNVWERSSPDAAEAVLFVHGVMTNARGLFVTPVEGDDSYSWLHAASDMGRAAFAMDQRGYGDSELPPEMDEPQDENDPIVRADRAAEDVGRVVQWLREEFDTVHLVGVSWGCHTTGRYLATGDRPVASVAHCAPVYKPAYDQSSIMDALSIEDYHRGWFTQDRETVRARSDHPPKVFDAIWRAQVESNQGVEEDTYAVQAGGIADWVASTEDDPAWDPASIDVPTMVFYGSDDEIADRQGSLECYDRLPVDQKEYAELAGVDHYMMHGHRRTDVFELVDDFQRRV